MFVITCCHHIVIASELNFVEHHHTDTDEVNKIQERCDLASFHMAKVVRPPPEDDTIQV